MAGLRKGASVSGKEEAQVRQVARTDFEVTLSVEATGATIDPVALGKRIVGAITRDETARGFARAAPRLRVSLISAKRTTPHRTFHEAARDFRAVLMGFVESLNEIDRANAPRFFDVIVLEQRRSIIRCDFGGRRVMWVPRSVIHPESDESNGKLAVLSWWAAMKGLIHHDDYYY